MELIVSHQVFVSRKLSVYEVQAISKQQRKRYRAILLDVSTNNNNSKMSDNKPFRELPTDKKKTVHKRVIVIGAYIIDKDYSQSRTLHKGISSNSGRYFKLFQLSHQI
jgi:diaminopimelate decarboxylase